MLRPYLEFDVCVSLMLQFLASRSKKIGPDTLTHVATYDLNEDLKWHRIGGRFARSIELAKLALVTSKDEEKEDAGRGRTDSTHEPRLRNSKM